LACRVECQKGDKSSYESIENVGDAGFGIEGLDMSLFMACRLIELQQVRVLVRPQGIVRH
jgi:hypothetical protein